MYWGQNYAPGYAPPNIQGQPGIGFGQGQPWQWNNQPVPDQNYQSLQHQSMLYSQQQNHIMNQQNQMVQQNPFMGQHQNPLMSQQNPMMGQFPVQAMNSQQNPMMAQQFGGNTDSFDLNTFDKQFSDWEKQYDSWKEQNKHHPDKATFEQYDKQWRSWREQLLEKRNKLTQNETCNASSGTFPPPPPPEEQPDPPPQPPPPDDEEEIIGERNEQKKESLVNAPINNEENTNKNINNSSNLPGQVDSFQSDHQMHAYKPPEIANNQQRIPFNSTNVDNKTKGYKSLLGDRPEMSGNQMMGNQQRMPGNQMMGNQQRMPGNQMMGNQQQRMPGNQMMGNPQRMPGNQMMGNQQGMPNNQGFGNPNRMPGNQMMGNRQRMTNDQMIGNQQRMPNDQMIGNQQRMPTNQMMGNQQSMPSNMMGNQPRMPNNQMMGNRQRMPNNQMMKPQNHQGWQDDSSMKNSRMSGNRNWNQDNQPPSENQFDRPDNSQNMQGGYEGDFRNHQNMHENQSKSFGNNDQRSGNQQWRPRSQNSLDGNPRQQFQSNMRGNPRMRGRNIMQTNYRMPRNPENFGNSPRMQMNDFRGQDKMANNSRFPNNTARPPFNPNRMGNPRFSNNMERMQSFNENTNSEQNNFDSCNENDVIDPNDHLDKGNYELKDFDDANVHKQESDNMNSSKIVPLMSLNLPNCSEKESPIDKSITEKGEESMTENDAGLNHKEENPNLRQKNDDSLLENCDDPEDLERKEKEIIQKAAQQLKEIRQKKGQSSKGQSDPDFNISSQRGMPSSNDDELNIDFENQFQGRDEPFHQRPNRGRGRGWGSDRNRGDGRSRDNFQRGSGFNRDPESDFRAQYDEPPEEKDYLPYDEEAYGDYERWWFDNQVWRDPFYSDWMRMFYPNFYYKTSAKRRPNPPMQGFDDFLRDRMARKCKQNERGFQEPLASSRYEMRTVEPLISIDYGHRSNVEIPPMQQNSSIPSTLPQSSVFSNVERFDYAHKGSAADARPDLSSGEGFNKFSGDYERNLDQREGYHVDKRRKLVDNVPRSREQSIREKQTKKPETVLIEDLLCPPGRSKRPRHILVVLRGIPGSGKSFVAKLIKEKELENGGTAPRMLCLDDYFMIDREERINDPDTGRRSVVKKMVYEYEAEMESLYRNSLFKSLKKNIDSGLHPFIIVDAPNERVKYFSEIHDYACDKGYAVFIAEMENTDPVACFKKNIHCRSLEEISQVVKNYQRAPSKYKKVDLRSILQDASITEVEMEDHISDGENKIEDTEKTEDESELPPQHEKTSKWEMMETTENKLDKLDGLKKKRKPQRMEDYLQLPDDYELRDSQPGKKRVRWCDLEERKDQERARAIGFVVGQTDWEKITDPDHADKALTKTKYI